MSQLLRETVGQISEKVVRTTSISWVPTAHSQTTDLSVVLSIADKNPLGLTVLIRAQAQSFLEMARADADAAAVADALIYAAGPLDYASQAGINACRSAIAADRRVAVLELLASGHAVFPDGGEVSIAEWRWMLLHFCRAGRVVGV